MKRSLVSTLFAFSLLQATILAQGKGTAEQQCDDGKKESQSASVASTPQSQCAFKCTVTRVDANHNVTSCEATTASAPSNCAADDLDKAVAATLAAIPRCQERKQ